MDGSMMILIERGLLLLHWIGVAGCYEVFLERDPTKHRHESGLTLSGQSVVDELTFTQFKSSGAVGKSSVSSDCRSPSQYASPYVRRP